MCPCRRKIIWNTEECGLSIFIVVPGGFSREATSWPRCNIWCYDSRLSSCGQYMITEVLSWNLSQGYAMQAAPEEDQ